MRNPIYISFSKVNHFLEKRLENSFQFVTTFGFVGIIAYPFFLVVYYKTEIWWSNVLGTLISLILLLSRYSIISNKYLYIYWFLFLIMLSFNFTYGVFTNSTAIDYHLGEMLMLIIFAIVISDILLLIIILSLSVLISAIVYGATVTEVISLLHLKSTGLIYLLGFFFAYILMRRKTKTEALCSSLKNKLEGMVSLAHCMAHELSTPLVVIKLGASNLKKFYPELIATYRLAKHAKLDPPNIPNDLLPLMEKILDDIENDAEAASNITQMLLMNVQDDKRHQENYQEISMYSCIEKALAHYPYRGTFDRNKIHWLKSRDFTFKGDQLLMVHVFLNLIKNAIRAILKAGKGGIEIHNESYANNNYVYFKDTGTGIKKEDIPHLFASFYSTHKEGTGLGLYFCKNTLENFGGDIYCEAEAGESTTFILQLPKCD